jgi:hypothetical protein
MGELPKTDGTAPVGFRRRRPGFGLCRAGGETLVKAGIVSGSGGTLDPLGHSTRSQMAQVLYNLLSK